MNVSKHGYNLTENHPKSKVITLVLAWKTSLNPDQNRTFLTRKQVPFDCDLVVFLLDDKMQMSDIRDVVYFGQLTHTSKSIVHQGDYLGHQEGFEQEAITLYFDQMGPHVKHLVVYATLYDGKKRKQDLGMMAVPSMIITDTISGQVLIKTDLDQTYAGFQSMRVCTFTLDKHEWSFLPQLEGVMFDSLKDLLNFHQRR